MQKRTDAGSKNVVGHRKRPIMFRAGATILRPFNPVSLPGGRHREKGEGSKKNAENVNVDANAGRVVDGFF
jgi:hypothetical protein